MSVLLTPPERHWVCPKCTHAEVSFEPPHQIITKMHNCAGLKGLSAPMVPEGLDCDLQAIEREDYVGTELVHTDGDGTPIMAVKTVREDGEDCAVYAPTAAMNFRAQ